MVQSSPMAATQAPLEPGYSGEQVVIVQRRYKS